MGWLIVNKFFFLLLIFSSLCLEGLDYQVRFEGIGLEAVDILRSVSQTVLLEKSPPETRMALQRRAQADIPNLLAGLHSLGLYAAEISATVEDNTPKATVVFTINPGRVYPLGDVEVELGSGESNPLEGITPRDIGLIVGAPALPQEILEAENKLLEILKERGYLFATIDKKVIAREATEEISLLFLVQPGPLIKFGPTNLLGLKTVSPDYVLSKIAWREMDPYDPLLLTSTQTALEGTGLFSTIAFEHAKEPSSLGELPFDVILEEACHRTIGAGGSYNTYLGPGVTFNWENRNAFHRGQKLSLKGDIFVILQNGKVEYTIPDFLEPCQRLRVVAEVEKEKTKGFTETFYSSFIHLDRFPTDYLRYSVGFGYKQLFSADSNNNEPFSLLKLPLSAKYTRQDDFLDPTSGGSFLLKAAPTYRFNRSPFFYTTLEGIETLYYPISWPLFQVFALKLDVGSIIGPRTRTIPPPERFYAGSENTLRGYRYLTVSPLNKDGKPIGGRSLFVFSAEHRIRFSSDFGWTTFYEVGNVYDEAIPRLDQKQLQSWGIGLRYYTPVGPLRADIAFPLNRRPIDRKFQVYLSIGQAF